MHRDRLRPDIRCTEVCALPLSTVQFQRFWIWAKRQNHKYRPSRPLTPQEETQSVRQLKEGPKKNNNVELNLFLEIEIGPDLRPVPPPVKGKDDILIFFKLYDPEKEQLRYVGRFFVKGCSKPTEIVSKLNEIVGFSPDEAIELYEEIKFEPYVMCERIDMRESFRSSQPVIHNIRLPKRSTVGDVLNEIKTKVELSHPDAELRLLEVFYHKIYKTDTITTIPRYLSVVQRNKDSRLRKPQPGGLGKIEEKSFGAYNINLLSFLHV